MTDTGVEGMKGKPEDYCDGCRNLIYEAETDSLYCRLNKEPKPHPDEPEYWDCDWKEED